MSLEAELSAWDGKSRDAISGIFQSHADEPGFLKTVIRLIDTAGSQRGATWILKACLEAGNTLSSRECATVFRSLSNLGHWEAKLHLLQSLPYIPIATEHRDRVEAFLRSTLVDDNKFVRAWAYTGFYELSRHHPEYRDECEQFFAMAMRDEAASVKARVRKLMAAGFTPFPN